MAMSDIVEAPEIDMQLVLVLFIIITSRYWGCLAWLSKLLKLMKS